MNEYNFPKEYTIGDTVEFTSFFDDFDPNDGWELKYVIISESEKNEISTVQNLTEKGFNVVLDDTLTSSWSYGLFQLYAELFITGSSKKTFKLYPVEIFQNLSDITITNEPILSWAKRTLNAVESLIEGRAINDAHSYTIGNRSITKMSALELMKWRDILRNEVEIEEAKNNNEKINTVSGVFGRIF